MERNIMLLHILYVNVLCYYDFILFKNVSLYKKTCLSLDSMTSVVFLFLFIKKKKKKKLQGIPWQWVQWLVRIPCFYCSTHRIDPWSGNPAKCAAWHGQTKFSLSVRMCL